MAYERNDRDDSKFSRPQQKRQRKKVCQYCIDRQEVIDYKDISRLRKCLTERGKILPRRVTGCCRYHQNEVTVAIKRARQIALIPYIAEG